MIKIILDIILIIICIFYKQSMEFSYNHSLLKKISHFQNLYLRKYYFM